jgi:gas vesicle protein GvpG
MLLVDDILLFPARSLLWIFREIHDQAVEEVANEGEAIGQQLRNLYMQLETNAITEAQFAAREKTLLDRLDAIEASSGAGLEEGELESVDEETPAHEPDR